MAHLLADYVRNSLLYKQAKLGVSAWLACLLASLHAFIHKTVSCLSLSNVLPRGDSLDAGSPIDIRLKN